MSKVALKIENFSSEELKSLLRKDEKFQQGIRLYACYQVSLGKRPKELEGIYETSFKSRSFISKCLTNSYSLLNRLKNDEEIKNKKSVCFKGTHLF